MQGYNGSQLWDTAFTVQAYISTGLHSDVSDSVRAAHTYIKNSQIVEEAEQPLSRNYRHVSKGAWPFSTRDHGWPISDCTGEESCPPSRHVSVHCTVVLISQRPLPSDCHDQHIVSTPLCLHVHQWSSTRMQN
jgi:hypothetical protein